MSEEKKTSLPLFYFTTRNCEMRSYTWTTKFQSNYKISRRVSVLLSFLMLYPDEFLSFSGSLSLSLFLCGLSSGRQLWTVYELASRNLLLCLNIYWEQWFLENSFTIEQPRKSNGKDTIMTVLSVRLFSLFLFSDEKYWDMRFMTGKESHFLHSFTVQK